MCGKIKGVNYGNPCESISGLWILIHFDDIFDERNTMYDWAKYLSFLSPKETTPSLREIFSIPFSLFLAGRFIPFYPLIHWPSFHVPLMFLLLSLEYLTSYQSRFSHLSFNSLHFRMTIIASCALKLHNFPLDSQKCHLEIGSCKYLRCHYDSVTTWGNLNSTWNLFPQFLSAKARISLSKCRFLQSLQFTSVKP